MDYREPKFDPNIIPDGLSEAFQEFVYQFGYTYDALNREPPSSITEEAGRTAWIEQDKRKVFLGRYAHRNLQKQYEDLTTVQERSTLSFEQMVKKFKDKFKLSSNLTLCNFKFRKLSQSEGESFDLFVIRVKKEAQACDFSCASADCSVRDTLIRDQLLIGTIDDEIRRQALKEEWGLLDLVSKGRSIEAASKGAALIKVKEEPPSEINRMGRPGKYSKKSRQRKEMLPKRCKLCSSSRCDGAKSCPAKKGTCFACNLKGHFRGAEICKKSFRRRSARKVSGNSETEEDNLSEETEETSEETEDENQYENEPQERKVKRLYSRIPTIRRVGGRRIPRLRKVESKYRVKVVIKEQQTPVFADTGADICVMSQKTANKLKLEVQETKMKIRPYGSHPKRCIGEYTGTIMYNSNVANAKIYIIDSRVETLLSGPVCEELGIISFNGANIYKTDTPTAQPSSEAKKELINRFPTLFQGIGTLKDHKVKLHVNKDIPPVRQPARPIPFHLRGRLEKELRKMEEENVIEEHHGPAPWVSNLVLAPKDDGGVRITVDMRQANKAIKTTNIPIPRPEIISSQLAKYKIFSKMDFNSAFHQLEIDEGSRALTVFHAGDRLMRYRRLTMGCSPASGELNKALRPLFQDIKNAFVIQDDVIVAGRTTGEHDTALDRVCEKIKEAGMTLNPDKCIIAKPEIPWWGMIISEKGLSPDPAKVHAMKHASRPQTKDELKSFFCMIQSNGYGKNFIKNLAGKTSNMRVLLRRNVAFSWTKACQKEFETLKNEFSEDILMQHYDPSLPTQIEVDASQSGLSALLVQYNDEDRKIVAVASRATTPTESRYPQLDLEALSVDYGLRRFRFYIAGGPKTLVITDHKPLESIFKNLRTGSIRTERIKLRHQDLNFEVRWKKGETNAADFLSRHATPLEYIPKDQREETHELEKTIWFLQFSPYTESISIERLIQATDKDATLQKLKKAICKGYINPKDEDTRPYVKIFSQLAITESGLIMKEERFVLPSSLVSLAIRKAHQGGHPGITSMKRRLRTHFYFPKLNNSIEDAVKKCKLCAMFTPKNRKNKLHPQTVEGYNAWEKVSVDLFGPMPDKRHIVVAQDMVSKFPAAKILNQTDADHVTEALREFYTSFGTPMVHRTDNGPPFNSEKFARFSEDRGIAHQKTFPYHPQANPVESFMKPLGKAMKTAYSARLNKKIALEDFLATYRSTPHSSTGLAPGDILLRHGYAYEFPKSTPPNDDQVRAALENDRNVRSQRDEELNQGRRQEQVNVGDQVLTKNENKNKFDPNFGPHQMVVTSVQDGGVTCLGDEGTVQRRHQDDVKLIPPTPNLPANAESTNMTQEPEGRTDETENTTTDIQTAPRRSNREKRQPLRLRDYHLQ